MQPLEIRMSNSSSKANTKIILSAIAIAMVYCGFNYFKEDTPDQSEAMATMEHQIKGYELMLAEKKKKLE